MLGDVVTMYEMTVSKFDQTPGCKRHLTDPLTIS